MAFFVVLVLMSVWNIHGWDISGPMVNTTRGVIRGLKARDGDYSMFMGVPFGRVRDEDPFGIAEPYPKFEYVLNAFDDSAMCPQREEINGTLVGSLDCLYLNIYVPNKANSNEKLPVLIWIFGGVFSFGFAGRYFYGPKFLVQHDVILVTLNYRVGPYGFMCLDIPEVPGNQGLKDQRLALRWIKENIAAFGGDADKITLMGESAGGVSVDLQLKAKQERLFNQIILQSGTAMAPSAIKSADTTVPLKIANRLGYATESLPEALTFLAKTDPKSVIGASNELGLTFGPCIEQTFDDVESIVTEHPLFAEMPNLSNTKILVGFNNKEELVKYALSPSSHFTNFDEFEIIRPSFIPDENFHAMLDILRRFYVGDEDPSEALRWKLMEFVSDWYFTYPTQWSVTDYVERNASDLYYYMFSYSGGRNFVKNRFNVTEEGAGHADEIGYLFDLSYENQPPSPDDQRMIDQITALWTNFVKYGEPTPQTTELLPVRWPPVTKDTHVYLEIGSELVVRRRPFNRRLTFLRLFFEANWTKLKFINSK